MEIVPDTPATAAGSEHDSPAISAGNGRGKIRLRTWQSLDGRTKAKRDFEGIVDAIIADITGGDARRASTIQRYLVEAFATTVTSLSDYNARRMLGQKVETFR